ncbi:MAG TPA: TraR/DksA C4-type zinc finger protein [bacterium]|nr:TraR/DksA C4-type zinc finger protein [bacterium]HPL95742.1 TraR/DksA C4-type zinc finger protein [bacterium]
MNQDFIEKIKKMLIQEKDRLEKQLEEFTDKNIHNKEDYETEFPDYGSEYDANAQEVAAFDDRIALEHQLEDELRDVKVALLKIADGSYGVCKYCHKEISADRLTARPTSSACVECKKKFKGEL